MNDNPPHQARPVSTWRKFLSVWKAGSEYLLRSAPGLCAAYLLAALAGAGAALGAARIFGDLVNALRSGAAGGTAQAGTPSLVLFLVWISLILIGIPLLGMLYQYLGARIDQHISIRLQNDAFRKLLSQPLPYFFRTKLASSLNLLNAMCRETRHAIRQVVLDSPAMLIILVAGLTVVVERLHDMSDAAGTASSVGTGMWVVIALLLLAALATPMLVERFGKRLVATETDLIDKEEALSSLTRSGVQSAEELKAFDAIDWYARRQRQRLAEVASSDIRQTVTIEKVNFVNVLPSHLMQGLLIGAALVIAIVAGGNTPQVGNLVTLLLVVPQLMRPLQGASALLMTLQKSWPNIERVFGMLESEPEPPAAGDGPATEETGGPAAVKVRDLVFRFDAGGPAILNGATFGLTPGRVTGLVARMGAGKTTFFRLVMRFFQPASGSIELDGRPLGDIPLPRLRREVAMLAQFPAFSPDSIRDNLHLAAPDATDDALREVCELTGIWGVLRRNVGEQLTTTGLLDQPFAAGTGISGGQRKLFALSRCLLRHPRLLLLDEPTTGIDNKEKFALLERLREACRGRTVLVVDHDVHWLGRFCDEILVLEDGTISARGTPDELLQSPNLYQELHAHGTTGDSPAGDS